MAAEESSSTACDPVGHIVRSQDTMGNKPRIAGTRIRVMDVAAWHERHGMSVEEILEQFPQLSAADVHAALAYYFDHRIEIEPSTTESERRAEEYQRDFPERSVVLPPE